MMGSIAQVHRRVLRAPSLPGGGPQNVRCSKSNRVYGAANVNQTSFVSFMKSKLVRKRMGLAVLSGGLAFVGGVNATELITDGSFENTSSSSLPVVKVGGKDNPDIGQGWSTFSTYLYSTQYTMPGPPDSGLAFLRPYPSGTYGVTQSSDHVQQLVDLTSGTTLTPSKIDAGQASFTMSAWFSSYRAQGDYSELTLQFLTAADVAVGDPLILGGSDFVANIPTESNSRYPDAKDWGQDVRTGTVPAGARHARVSIQATSVSGAPDGYVDVVSLDVVDASAGGPFVSAAVPANNAIGVGPDVNLNVTIQDLTTAVNPSSVKLFLDSTLLGPTVNKVETNTFVKIDVGILPALSEHTYSIVFGDTGTPTTTQTNNFHFTVIDYLTLPAALRTALGSEDSSKPGFNVAVYQADAVDSSLSPTQAVIPSSIGFEESVLAGLVGPNIADLTAASSGDSFVVPGTINWVNSTGVSGNFPNDGPFPGIPGTTGTEVGFVDEIQTYVRFPVAGYYQMGINNDDSFRLTAATTGVQTLQITSPTNSVIPCVPIATNITQLQMGGALPKTPLTGQIVYATPSENPDDSCSIGTNTALAGKIVLLDIGATNCTSAAKAEQAQTAGAIAAILIQSADMGYPFRVDDTDPNVHIPVLVIAQNYGGADLKTLLKGAQPVTASIQTDTNPRLAEWDSSKGFGAVDTIFGFAVTQPGIYPLRLVAGQESGAASLEWFSINPDGSRALINDTTDPTALLTFRARSAPAVFNAPTRSGQNITLSWTGSGTLKESVSVKGPWTTSANQANPQTIPATGPQKFFVIVQ